MEPRYIAVKAKNEWKINIKLDLKALANALFKGISFGLKAQLGLINTSEALDSATTLFGVLKIKKEDAIEHKAYLLIYSAIRQALFHISRNKESILEETLEGENPEKYEATAFEAMMEMILLILEEEEKKQEFKIEEWFFKRPQDLPVVAKVKQVFLEVLQRQGISDLAAQHLAGYFPSLFVRKLNELRAEKQDYFEPLREYFKDWIPEEPFRNREAYDKYLIGQWNKPFFDEEFSVADVYVDLNACYPKLDIAERGSDGKIKHIVCDAGKHIEDWILDPNPAYQLMVLKGGPGSGKSTIMRKLASELAIAKDRPVFFIPLNHLVLKDRPEETIESFLKYEPETRLLDPPLQIENVGQTKKPFFIFDGLDELSRSGKAGEEDAAKLIDQILGLIKRYNDERKWDIRILLTGRDLIIDKVQGELGKNIGQVLELLPYSIKAEKRDWEKHEFFDSEKRLDIDLRHQWWQNYSERIGKSERSVPEKILKSKINAVSVQPILCYFIAKLYFANSLTAEVLKDPNSVYQELFVMHYEREEKRRTKSKAITFESYIELLEILAQTTWQNGEIRATTSERYQIELRRYGREADAKKIKHINENAGEGLLLSFFSKIVPNQVFDEQLIEFTHKSFGEYLAARRIVSEAIRIGNLVGGDSEKAITEWLHLTAKEEMSEYIWDFLEHEVALQFNQKPENAGEVQKALVGLFSKMINDGFSLKSVKNEKTNLDIIRASRNAESSLLLTISAFARVSGEQSKIKWRDAGHPKRVLTRVMLGVAGLLGKALFACVFPEKTDFSMMNLQYANLQRAHLYGADLYGANLQRADLYGANLQDANLVGANLQDADLYGANLQRADCFDANLQRANLQGANFYGAELQAANLQRANLQSSHLQAADLFNAHLQRADLVGANLQDADLQDANLERANLEGAILIGANLRGAHLQHTNLQEANLQNANLQNAKIYPFKLGDKTMQGQEAYDYLVKRGAINVPKP